MIEYKKKNLKLMLNKLKRSMKELEPLISIIPLEMPLNCQLTSYKKEKIL